MARRKKKHNPAPDVYHKSTTELLKDVLFHFVMFWVSLVVLLIRMIDAAYRSVAQSRVRRRDVVRRGIPPFAMDAQSTRAPRLPARRNVQLPTAEWLWADTEKLPKEQLPAWLR